MIVGPSRTAVLVVDVQVGVFAHVYERSAVVATIGEVVTRARAAGVPVVWIQQTDDELPRKTAAWQIVTELEPGAREASVEKQYGNSFDATDLDAILTDFDVRQLLVTGGMTDQCVRSTLHGGLLHGYDMTLIADAHTCADVRQRDQAAPSPAQVIAHTNLYWANQRASNAAAAVVAADDLTFT